jgi:phosphohistidine phosphatase
MKRLILMRHAKAVPPEGMADEARMLAPRGRLAMERMAGFFRDRDLTPDLALVSSSTRTRETWLLLEPAFSKKPAHRFVPELYSASRGTLFAIIQQVPASVNTLLVIGHNPGLEEITRSLASSGEAEALMRFGRGMPTAAVALFDLSINDWKEIAPKKGRMELFVTPKSLGGDDD